MIGGRDDRTGRVLLLMLACLILPHQSGTLIEHCVSRAPCRTALIGQPVVYRYIRAGRTMASRRGDALVKNLTEHK